MKRSGFALFGIALLALFAAVVFWQTPGLAGSKLTKPEIERYLGAIGKVPFPPEEKRDVLARVRAWAEADDGRPVYMLNLMRYFDHVRSFPGAPTTGTPRMPTPTTRRATAPMLMKRGGYPILSGSTSKVKDGQGPESNLMVYRPDLDNWDRVLVVRYPGRRTFLQLVTSPEYLKVESDNASHPVERVPAPRDAPPERSGAAR